jgi:hypothetical protein
MHPEPNVIQMIFEFMVRFIVLAFIYFIIDLVKKCLPSGEELALYP